MRNYNPIWSPTVVVAFSFQLAFTSFVYELVLAQALAAALGGTVMRYATTIGVFTFSLGLGAFAESFLSKRIRPLLTLVAIQFVLCVVGGAGPLFIRWIDPVAHPEAPELALEILAYLPILAVGFLSGFELPLLMRMDLGENGGGIAAATRAGDSGPHAHDRPNDNTGPNRPSGRNGLRVLAADYLGMFAACMMFPFVLLPTFGVLGSGLFAATLSAIAGIAACLLMVWTRERRPGSPGRSVNQDAGESANPGDRWSRILPITMIFVLSFCSLGYELILAKTLGDLINDEIISQSLSIGFFLLGLGVGAWRSSLREWENPLRSLYKIEVGLTIIGVMSVVIFYFFATLQRLYLLNIFDDFFQVSILIAALLPIVFLIGFLSGFELPLLMRGPSFRHPSQIGFALGFNYLGALAAGVMVPLVLIPELGAFRSVVVVALLNFSCCMLLLRPSGLSIFRRPVGLAVAALALAVAGHGSTWVEQVFLKTSYFRLSLLDFNSETLRNFNAALRAYGDIQRIETRYQTIDLVGVSASRVPDQTDDFSLFLNRQPQFSESTWKTYHESLAFGAINLAGRVPRSVLILGGGDGLLASYLVRISGVESITLVELDPVMIELANLNSKLSQMNGLALKDPRVRVFIDDGFRFIRSSPERFDAIFIDFPYPVSFDLSRLYSIEFYSAVRSRLNKHGFAVFDAPIWRPLDRSETDSRDSDRPHSYDILLSTLTAAGYRTVFPFGPLDPFVFLQEAERDVAFDYSRLPAEFTNRAFVNLTDLNFLVDDAKIDKKYINSVFRPKKFN